MKKVVCLLLALTIALSGLGCTPIVKAKTVEKYFISMNSKKDFFGAYTKRIKVYKKKIVVWGKILNKKNKTLKYKKRVFKSKKAIKYGYISGVGTRTDKKYFFDVLKSYVNKKGKVTTKKGGIYITLIFKNGKLYRAAWSS